MAPHNTGVRHNTGVGVQALAFFQLGISLQEIYCLLGPTERTIYHWRKTVIKRRYNPGKPEKILFEYLTNKL
jgi:hypothetical protein